MGQKTSDFKLNIAMAKKSFELTKLTASRYNIKNISFFTFSFVASQTDG